MNQSGIEIFICFKHLGTENGASFLLLKTFRVLGRIFETAKGKKRIFSTKVVFKHNFCYLCIMRKIIAYKNYFNEFLKKLSEQEVVKILNSLDMLTQEEKVPRHYIKYIRDGLYEFRVTYKNNEFRIFFIYDGNVLVVLFNGLKKKMQKLPKNEIIKALKLKEEYYATKGNQ